MVGKIIKYVQERGFGFIQGGEDDDRYFFHISNVKEPLEICHGADVEFEYGNNDKGWFAYDISILEEDEESDDYDEEEYEDTRDIGVENLSMRNYIPTQPQIGNLYLKWYPSEFGGGWFECQTCGSTQIAFGLGGFEPDIAECSYCGAGYIVYV